MADITGWITVGGRHIPLGNVGKFNPTKTKNSSSSKESKSNKLSDKDFKTIKSNYSLTLRKTSSNREFVRIQNKKSKKVEFAYNSDKEITFSTKSSYIKTTGKALISKLKGE